MKKLKSIFCLFVCFVCFIRLMNRKTNSGKANNPLKFMFLFGINETIKLALSRLQDSVQMSTDHGLSSRIRAMVFCLIYPNRKVEKSIQGLYILEKCK